MSAWFIRASVVSSYSLEHLPQLRLSMPASLFDESKKLIKAYFLFFIICYISSRLVEAISLFYIVKHDLRCVGLRLVFGFYNNDFFMIIYNSFMMVEINKNELVFHQQSELETNDCHMQVFPNFFASYINETNNFVFDLF
ncbi:hypothetical protein BpHYR1_045759 [Brachionus plicatilis]|uniref:Uncharacterized protein n=1 Tax=Brachionus plicatilis TaxID=10195 RepID=A0A3M7RDH5_BRAPC|nr:hypothetical protein BpHYR1_045759 [Brachionus plicatilis]